MDLCCRNVVSVEALHLCTFEIKFHKLSSRRTEAEVELLLSFVPSENRRISWMIYWRFSFITESLFSWRVGNFRRQPWFHFGRGNWAANRGRARTPQIAALPTTQEFKASSVPLNFFHHVISSIRISACGMRKINWNLYFIKEPSWRKERWPVKIRFTTSKFYVIALHR